MGPYGGYDDQPELAELYDALPLYNQRQDVEFYIDLCRNAPGDILEVGCGTGRILIPAALEGCVIAGLDISARMLARCRAAVENLPPVVRPRVALHRADMTRFDLGRRFALIIAPFRPLQHLVAVPDQLRFLDRVAAHLAPGGLLAFDVFHPDPSKLTGPIAAGETEDTPETPLPGGRSLRRSWRILSKRPAEQVNEIEIAYYISAPGLSERRIPQRFPMRYFYRFEVEHLLARAGFQLTHLYGDFDRSPLGDDSPEMIFIAEKRPPATT
ncbi:MAG: class I SAM-dependent methyltransferase [Bryobacteraceae bacterium]|nr:class I SAM-dependent methyltransferase [Bryobacteraceae bacterium]